MKRKACTKRLKLKKERSHKATSWTTLNVKHITEHQRHTSPDNMALIYKKVPLYKVAITWDNNDPNLSEVYKLQSNNPCNKSWVEIYKDNLSMASSSPSIRPSLSLTREQKNATLTGPTPLQSLRMCSRATIEQPGNRCFMSTFRSPLMRLSQYRLSRIAIWKKTSIKQFSSSFSKRWTRKSLGIGSISIYSPAETMSSRSWWCRPPWNIFEDSKRWSGWQKPSQWETCIHPIKRCSLSGSICLSTRKTGPSTLKAADVFLRRRSSHSSSTSRTFSTLKLQIDPWQRSANARSSNASDARCVMSFASGMMRRCAMWWNNVTEVTTVATNGLRSTVAPTSSGRITVIAIVVTHTTSATRNRMTRFLLSATTRRSSHAWCMGLRVNTPLRNVTRIQGMQNVNPMTGSVRMKRITMTRATRAKTMSHATALTHQPQVRIRRQLQVGAKNMKMRITIFKLPKEWRQVAMCLTSMTIHVSSVSPRRVTKKRKEKNLLPF